MGKHARWCVVLLALLGVITCTDEQSPTEPTDGGPDMAIVDAAHGGIDGFYFLPPIVPPPTTDGVFDGALLGDIGVDICHMTGGSCGTVLAGFTSTTGPGSETVRLGEGADRYIVNWHTDEFSLTAGETYRITIRVAGTALGYADMIVVSSGKDLRNANTGDVVALKDGRTLPIAFRIEERTVTVVGDAGGRIEAADGGAVLTIPPDAIDGPVGITVTAVESAPGAVPGTTFEFGPDGLVFEEPVELEIRYDPADLAPGTDPSWLRIHRVVNGTRKKIARGTAHPALRTVRARIGHFSTYTVAPTSPLTWTLEDPSDSAYFKGVWAAAKDDALAVGYHWGADQGVSYRFNGSNWTPIFTGVDETLEEVWGFAANDVYAVGEFGTLFHFNGTAWTSVTSFQDLWLGSLWGPSPNDLHMCGWDYNANSGILLRYDGAVGDTLFYPDRWCADLWGAASDTVFAVTDDQILTFDGNAWTSTLAPAYNFDPSDKGGIWGLSGSEVIAVGEPLPHRCFPSVILRYDGADWAPDTIPLLDQAGNTLNGAELPSKLWGASSTEIYAITGMDRCTFETWTPMWRYDGSNWIQEVQTNQQPLLGWQDIHGVADAVFAVQGREGFLLWGIRN